MHIAKLRQVGGSVMVAIPPAFLDQLHLAPRAEVGLAIEGGRLVIAPAAARPTYSLAELLAQCDPDAPMPAVDADWTAGREIGAELI